MSHETPTLDAKKRDRLGSRFAKRERAAGLLPAVIYGHGAAPMSVTINEKAMLTALKHGSHVVNVRVEGGATDTCLVKDLQFGYLGDNVIHVDLARVNLDEIVTVNVALHFVGTPEMAKKAGNIVTHDLAQLEVRCKVRDIPEEVRVDLSLVMHGMTLSLGDVKLPQGVTPSLPADHIICRIQTVQEVVTTAEATTAEATTQPEVIKEKKDEKAGEEKKA
ncbi:MAG: 50S ribosomal protein L25 [Phycisphaerae bacterium]|jgi:large subunit ribosomal protein L25|nr:50S ribosomal protein L25 [Phycisphaerae bacterium]